MHVKGKVIKRKKTCLSHCIRLMTSQFTPRSTEACKTEEKSLIKKSKNVRQNTNKKL